MSTHSEYRTRVSPVSVSTMTGKHTEYRWAVIRDGVVVVAGRADTEDGARWEATTAQARHAAGGRR